MRPSTGKTDSETTPIHKMTGGDVSPTIAIPNDIDARKFHSLRLQDVEDKGSELILPEVAERMVTDAFSSLRTGYASGSVGSFHGVVGVLERATKRGWEGNPA